MCVYGNGSPRMHLCKKRVRVSWSSWIIHEYPTASLKKRAFVPLNESGKRVKEGEKKKKKERK